MCSLGRDSVVTVQDHMMSGVGEGRKVSGTGSPLDRETRS